MSKRRPKDRRRSAGVMEYVIDRIKKTERRKFCGATRKILCDLGRQRIDDERQRRFDIRIIRGTRDLNAQPLRYPSDQDCWRTSAPPVFAVTDVRGINGIKGVHALAKRL